MIDPHLPPPPPHPRPVRFILPRQARIQQQVLHLRPFFAQPLEDQPRKGPRRAQILQVERQHGQAVPGAVEPQSVIRGLGAGHIAGAEDEAVAVGCVEGAVGEELLDDLEALAVRVSACCEF